MKSAITAEKKHMKAVANTNDLGMNMGFPRTNFCIFRPLVNKLSAVKENECEMKNLRITWMCTKKAS